MRIKFFSLMAFFATNNVLFALRVPCGPPNNLTSLPDFVQEELVDLWKSWKQSTNCDKELLIQADILSASNDILAEELRNTEKSENNSEKNTDLDKLVSIGSSDYKDLDLVTLDDVASMQFNTVKAPFLRTASPEVKKEFERVWKNDDIPSEGLRTLKIQHLAVSLLNSKQLEEYNTWATMRRKVLKAREQEISQLSSAARRALHQLSISPTKKMKLQPRVKQELRDFMDDFNQRRNRKLVLH